MQANMCIQAVMHLLEYLEKNNFEGSACRISPPPGGEECSLEEFRKKGSS